MNSNQRNQLLRVSVALLVCLALIACGGGQLLQPAPDTNLAPTQPGSHDPADPGQLDTGPPDDGSEPRAANILRIDTPVLAGMSAGREFEVTLAAELVDEVYQGSFRLLFDPMVMEPVSVTRGGMLDSGMIHLAGLDQRGFVPFSFTALPGGRSIEPASGELLRVRFRLLTAPQGTERVRLQNDAEFLQLRDRDSRRLRFDLESRNGGVQ